MKQPELGSVILDLRQKRNMTQEELVEQCNISVRTLQRIEAGDVTPRDFTIKALLSVLDYDLAAIETSLENKKSKTQLHIAWIAGLVYAILGLLEVGVDFYRFESNLPFYFPMIYTIVKSASLVSFVLFMIGFIAVGNVYKSFLLKISAYFMIGSLVFIELHDIISIFSSMNYEEFVMIKMGESIAFGGFDVVFGIALLKLARPLGSVAAIGGVLEIIIGICFVSVVLAIGGLVLTIPATLIEVILLYKCYEGLK